MYRFIGGCLEACLLAIQQGIGRRIFHSNHQLLLKNSGTQDQNPTLSSGMSNCNCNQPPSSSVGGTLTGGIQDISAILPLIGTEQCETHVGSALAGGYLYSASAVLSIFGSLGIVKAGISVLVACITFPKPWMSDHDIRGYASEGKLRHSMVLGARMLNHAGFGLRGDVAPLIGIDGERFKAETKLIQIMEEKHIDNPAKVSIKWKSRNWNIMLVLLTTVASVISLIPYFALLLGQASWRPTTHVPWLFPILRTVGSCFASVLCQFMIQARVISLMKHRIMFMDIHRQLSDGFSKDNKDGLDNWVKEHKLQWDSNLPAEQCILNLERFLASSMSATQTNVGTKEVEPHVSIEMEDIETPLPSQEALPSQTPFPPYADDSIYGLSPWVLPPPPPPVYNKDFKFEYSILQALRHKHFPTPTSDRTIMLISWTVLLLSLPALVAGYVGCFTLVSASMGNGPLVWLGLEAALSIIRIFIWAWNPSFDEDTGITVELELTDHAPMVTTVEHNTFIHYRYNKNIEPLALVREREFLEWITPFTGPLDQFPNPVNVALYFTLTADNSVIQEDLGRKYSSLLLTVFDFNTRVGATLVKIGGVFHYFDTEVKYDTVYNETIANLQLPMSDNHFWQKQDSGLFASLEDYYNSVGRALNSRAIQEPEGNTALAERRWKPFWKATRQAIEKENISILDRRWDLFPRAIHSNTLTSSVSLPDLTDHNQLYLDRGYEHHLKTKLVEVWSQWIVKNMGVRARDARDDCYEALANETSEKAKWELTELDFLVVLEWANRELALLTLSIKLEENLRLKAEECITTICKERHDSRLEQRMRSEIDVGRRKRLDRERGEAKRRMEQAMKDWEEQAEREGRSWKDQDWFAPMWQRGIDFVDKRWSEGISREPEALGNKEYGFDDLGRHSDLLVYHDERRYNFVAQLEERFAYWRSQRETERREMDVALDRICRVDGQRQQMHIAYKYPEPDEQAAYKFVELRKSTSKGRACSATVYDAYSCPAEAVCDVIKQSTTRSVIRVHPDIVASIPPNDHLLFLSCSRNGKEPAFVQDNRDRWWQQQTTNSALFYFTPQGVFPSSCYAYSGPIAQIFVFLAAPSRIRLRLLHYSDNDISIAIQHKGKTLHTLSAEELPRTFKLQSMDLEELGAGRHELQVVAVPKPEEPAYYYLRDILIEFFMDDSSTPGPASANDANEIGPVIGAAYDEEEISSRSRNQSPLPPPDTQDSESYILSESGFLFKTGV